jgi:hypothetical protein
MHQAAPKTEQIFARDATMRCNTGKTSVRQHAPVAKAKGTHQSIDVLSSISSGLAGFPHAIASPEYPNTAGTPAFDDRTEPSHPDMHMPQPGRPHVGPPA